MVKTEGALQTFRFDDLLKEKCILWMHRDVQSVDLHDHAFLELSYILRGNTIHTLDGESTCLGEGDYVIVDYGSRHSYRSVGSCGFDNIDCLFLPELLDPVLRGTRSLQMVLEHYLLHFNIRALVQNPAHMVFHDKSGRIRELIGKIESEMEQQRAGYIGMVRCYLLEILLLTMRELEGAQTAAGGQDPVGFLKAYVSEHYAEPLKLSELCRNAGYSLPYLSQRFKKESGIGFVEYLQNYRILQAKRLLTDRRLSVGEVAEAVGYRDVKFFSSCFRRRSGMSPAAFRKSIRG